MESVRNEGITTVDQVPQAIECLIMPGRGVQEWRVPHFHDYIELLYVLEGAYELRVDSAVVRLDRGSLYVILPGQPHCTRRLEERQVLLCVKALPRVLFSGEAFAARTDHLLALILERYSARRLFDAGTLAGTFIPQAMEEICAEHENRELGYELALRTHVSRVFLWLARYWHEQAGQPLSDSLTPGAVRALSTALTYIRENYSCATLASTAAACGLSYGYFSNLFSAYMKTSFSSYLRTVRLNASLPLLLSTDMSVTKIALEVGFSSASYYIQAFREQMGVPPLQFRRSFSPD